MMAATFKACSVDGCNGNAARAAEGRRGFCSIHYWRLKRHGDVNGGDMVRPFQGTLTAERLRGLLKYDPGTGVFTWLVNRYGAKIGDIAGKGDGHGYMKISIGGRHYKAHRLAVLYMTGEWPAQQIDHIDRDKVNNRWLNLREATHAQNMRNRGPRRDSVTGVPGVTWHAGASKWQVHAWAGGKNRYFGLFVDFEAAVAARKAVASTLFGEFAPA